MPQERFTNVNASKKYLTIFVIALAAILSACSDDSENSQEGPDIADEPLFSSVDQNALPAVDLPKLRLPEEAIPDVAAQLDSSETSNSGANTTQQDPGEEGPATSSQKVETLSLVEPVGKPAKDIPDTRDGHRRNGSGKLYVLDNHASLACANVEVAITAIDEDDTGRSKTLIAAAVESAEKSELDEITAWATDLTTAAEPSEPETSALIGFLGACSDGGYTL